MPPLLVSTGRIERPADLSIQTHRARGIHPEKVEIDGRSGHHRAVSTQVPALSTIWSTMVHRCPLPVERCLFRITEGDHVERVRRHGTDRYGLDRPVGCTAPPWTAVEWRRFGYWGPWRPFADVIYASTAAEVEASVRGAGHSALLKIPETEAPHVLIYRADAFVPVHDGQYAFRDPSRRLAALLGVVRIESA